MMPAWGPTQSLLMGVQLKTRKLQPLLPLRQLQILLLRLPA